MKKKLTYITDLDILKHKVKQFNEPVSLEQMDELTQYSYAHNSLLALKNDWNLFVKFCQSKAVTALPASVTATRLFFESESKVRKYSSIRRYSVTIGLIHRLFSKKDPTINYQVRQSLMSLRINKKGDEEQATGFTNIHLKKLYAKYSNSKLTKEIRDLAIYHVMFECALKRSELKQLTFEQIETNNDSLILSLDQNKYQLSPDATYCLGKWLRIVDRDSPYVFRSIDKHGNVAKNILDDSSIFRILRNAGNLLGQPELKFSGQSARVGAVQELSRQGYNVKEIQIFGRWTSPAMPYQYIGSKSTAEKEKLTFFSFKPWE